VFRLIGIGLLIGIRMLGDWYVDAEWLDFEN
jgi:hypothetical protein